MSLWSYIRLMIFTGRLASSIERVQLARLGKESCFLLGKGIHTYISTLGKGFIPTLGKGFIPTLGKGSSLLYWVKGFIPIYLHWVKESPSYSMYTVLDPQRGTNPRGR